MTRVAPGVAAAGRVLAVDFDGVLVDATEECALVTWYAPRVGDLSRTDGRLAAGVPEEFKVRFAQIRPYARTFGGFAVALSPTAGHVRSQADFDRAYRAIPPDEARVFVVGAHRVRAVLRARLGGFWLSLHRVPPGVPGLLARFAGRTHVVTARDAASTRLVLAAYGLAHHVATVQGNCTDKAAAVDRLRAQLAIPAEEIVFLDDNLTNVEVVAATGVTALWVRWGWHTAEHEERARAIGVAALDHPAEVGPALGRPPRPVSRFCPRCESAAVPGR